MKLSDILLLPGRYYRKLNDNKLTLFAGIVLVGIIDLFLPYLLDNFKLVFIEKAQDIVMQNILIAVALVFLLGVIDVFFFAIPLFDLFKVFKKENENGRVSLIRLMKIYISAHLLILPVNLLLYFFFPSLDAASDSILIFLIALVILAIIAWFAAIVSRGVNTMYSFEPAFRRLVFASVLLWNFFLSSGLEYILNNWLWKLFR